MLFNIIWPNDLGASRNSERLALRLICLMLGMVAVGCSPSIRKPFEFRPASLTDQRAALAWQESNRYAVGQGEIPEYITEESPKIFDTYNISYWDISLPEVIHIGMTNSRVLRDLGGRLVSQPGQVVTTDVPELVRTDPAGGVDAALAAFDAQVQGILNYNKTENGLRNPIIGSPILDIKQERGRGSLGFTKTGQAGTRYSLAHGHIYDADNVGVPPSRFGKAFDTFLNLEARHPLARGGGRTYNAIAGPNSPFGVYNGYWIAGIRSDIANDELQIAVRDYLYNIIRTYWLLRFAYDNVESARQVSDIAREMLDAAQQKYDAGVVDENFLLQAKERHLAAQQAYDDALSGPPERQLAGIFGPNGALISGTELGLRSLERRLRLLIGLSAGQGGVLRPCDIPSQAPVLFDHQVVLRNALVSRPELRRQCKVIEERRMQWIAARNLRLPSVDLVGQYRLHGFGSSVFGDSQLANDSSFSEFLKGDLHDIGAGIEITRPVGNRLASTAERNAMIAMSRESAILDQQKLQISFEVSGALAEVERVLRALELSGARLSVARKSLDNLTTEFDAGVAVPIETVLEAKRAIAQLQLAYEIARVDYSIALASLAVAQGTLLNEAAVYCGPNGLAHTQPSIQPPASLALNQPHLVTLIPPTAEQAENTTENSLAVVQLGAPEFSPEDQAPVAEVSLMRPQPYTQPSPELQLASPIDANQSLLR